MSLKDIAQETLKILEEGKFINSLGKVVDFSIEQKAAVEGTKLYPHMVANAFGQWLREPNFQGCFDRVVFGVYDPSKNQATLKAFQNRFP